MNIQVTAPPTASKVLTDLNALVSEHGKIEPLMMGQGWQHTRMMHKLLLAMLIEHEGDSSLGEFLTAYRNADISHAINLREDDITDAEDAALELVSIAETICEEMRREMPEEGQ